ncbi:homoserine kinase [Kordiimonas gwangyangensis]|uniref:homoserine kinase n=1 Tax=Kordiimonas gwangyangensis TaxID=288022 RepID=UPI00036DA1FD|nr:homoserine kinase [Kordiimonas gwangyangensis]
MAVYTHVDDRTLADFLSGYDVGTATSFKGIAEGVENSNYLLETTKARFILTLYEKRADPKDLPYFLNMMEHLAGNGIPSPLPIRANDGDALRTLSGRPACLISFLTGVSVKYPSADQCAELGAMLARMHKAAEGFGEVRENNLSIDGWHKLAEATRDRADEVMPGLAALIADELAYLDAKWPSGLPRGTIHADLFPDNVLFSGDKITGVIDFYFGCTDYFAYDIAICINAWCFDGEQRFDAVRAKRLTELYDTHRRLTGAEVAALPMLCRGAALRFLLTRLYDWLNPVEDAVVKPHNPLEYVRKLKFHQQVRDAADYVV